MWTEEQYPIVLRLGLSLLGKPVPFDCELHKYFSVVVFQLLRFVCLFVLGGTGWPEGVGIESFSSPMCGRLDPARIENFSFP